MLPVVYQIIICLVSAAVLGFIIGWIFSSFIRNEKHENQITALKDKFDENTEEINKIESNFEAKQRELSIVKKEYATVQKEILTANMDYDYENKDTTKLTDLEYDNKILTRQIKEQKICEDEIETLKIGLEEEEEKNRSLQQQIDGLKEFESGYKNNIHRIAELESQQKSSENEEIINLELKELENEKQNLIDSVEELKHENLNLKDKIKKFNITTQNIDEDICKDGEILKKSDLSLIGLENDKVTKVIKNLFK